MSLPSFFRRNSLGLEMAACYALFSILIPIGQALKPYVGEAADILQMAGYFWPYPVFLALQTRLAARVLWPLVLVVGLLVVLGFATFLRSRFTAFRQPSRWAYLAATVLWYVPLFLLQGLLMLAMGVLGYPVGE